MIDFKSYTGANGDDLANDTDELVGFLTKCSKSGDEGWVPPGRYLIDPVSYTLQGDMTVRCSPQAEFAFHTTAKATKSLITLRSNRRFRAEWERGTFDARKGQFVDSKASASGLSLIGLAGFDVERTHFYGADHWSQMRGDSGVTFSNNGRGYLTRCRFNGWADIGVYGGGGANADSEADDGEGAVIRDCEFTDCHIAVSNKRRGEVIDVVNCQIYGGRYGVNTYQVKGIPAGRRNRIIGTDFHDVSVNPILLRECDDAQIIGNRIHGFGWESGQPVTDVVPVGIILEGSRDCIIAHNVIDAGQAHASFIGVRADNSNYEGRERMSEGNKVIDNVVRNVGKKWVNNGGFNMWRG